MHNFLNHILNIQVALAQPFAQTSSSGGTGGTPNVASETGNQVTNLVTTIFQSIPYWVTGFLVIVLTLILSRVVKSTVENRMAEAGVEEEHKEIQLVVSRTATATVLLIGITAGLKIAGLDLTSIIAAAAFGVGFALKDLIMNFISGIIVLLQKQFTIGDWIKVKGTEGVIKEIQSRYTIIKKFDGTNVIVPNSQLFKNQVNSLTSNPERRFTINISVDFYLDLKEVIDTIYKSIDKCDKILKRPKPNIIVQQPGKFYNSLKIRAWVVSKKGILRPISALVRQIHKDFYRKGWSWPYPTQNLILDKDVQPDVTVKAKNYIDKHKKALRKKTAVVQQQEQILAQQTQASQKPVESGSPAQPLPQAQQIGVGGPEMEAPVWLQQAATQAQQPESTNIPLSIGAAAAPQTTQPQVTIQSIEIGPEVKTVSQEPAQAPAAQPQMSSPVVSAPDVAKTLAPAPTVSMPLPDVEPQITANQNQQQ